MRLQTKKTPKEGDRRILSKFAFTPVVITDRVTVWFQFYRVVEWYKAIDPIIENTNIPLTEKTYGWVHGYNTLQDKNNFTK